MSDRADLAWVADNGDHDPWDFEAWAVADLQLGPAGQLAHAELHAMTDEEYAALRDGPRSARSPTRSGGGSAPSSAGVTTPA